MMVEVVINTCFGGFHLSQEAVLRGREISGDPNWGKYTFAIQRDDPILVQVVKELQAEKASGKYSNIKIVQVPDDVSWHIHEYDGLEHVAEDHRTWG